MTTLLAARDRDLEPTEQVPARVRPGRLVDRAALAAVVLFALVGIGTPLLGLTTFANTDLLVANSPYLSAGMAEPHVVNRIANDVVASVLPSTSLFFDELGQGRLAAWNPYVGGGGALGAVPNYAVLSPLTLPYYVLPAWMAPAFVKLLEILVAVGGSYLFLRRLRLGRAAALLGGLAFATSAFMIVWTNWPQTRVAAFIPVVFWATERLVTQRRTRDGALLATALAGMLFGGFPAVTGYTVLTAGGYLVVRAVARGRAVAPIVAGLGALAGAVMITAIQLLPFASAMRHAKLSGRGQTGAHHLDPAALITSWAPWSLGLVNNFPLKDNAVESFSYVGAAGLVLFFVAVALPSAAGRFLPRGVWGFLVGATVGWAVLIYLGGPPLEIAQKLPVLFADNFVGRARSVFGFLVAVLVAVGFEIALRAAKATVDDCPAGVPLRGRHRAVALSGPADVSSGWRCRAWAALGGPGDVSSGWRRWAWAALGGPGDVSSGWRRWAWAALGGPGDVSSGWRRRGRAALGGPAEMSLGGRRRAAAIVGGPAAMRLRGWRLVWAGCVGLAGLAALALTVLGGWSVVSGPDSAVGPRWFALRVAAGLAIMGLTALAVLALWRTGRRPADRRRRALTVAAAVVVPALVLVQALTTVYSFWPRVDRDTWYPQTDVHRYLAAHLGHERFAAANGGMYPGADSAARLRSLTGEAFFDTRFAETVRGLPGEKFSSTLLRLPATSRIARSPLLDRLAVRYLVTTPWAKPFGPETLDGGDGTTVTIRPGQPRTVRLAAKGPIRGVGVTPSGTRRDPTRIFVSVRDARGIELAAGGRLLWSKAGEPAYVAVAGDGIPAGTPLTAVITVDGDPVTVAGAGGLPAMSTVAAADDGLRLAYAGNSTVWERPTALPRIRWASEVYVGSDPQARVSAMIGGGLRPGQVVLDDEPARAPDGKPATVTVTEDGTDDITARVDARGAGYLVVADPLQNGWGATVDGTPATLVPADHGMVAVAVPAGAHTVRLSYRMPMHNAGAWVSGAALVVLLGIGLGAALRRRNPTA